ncbi:MAG: hypothetical protein ACOYMG_24610 [Candidatus Methylumidiphilus sp.]
MKILYLHGWQSVPGGVKPTFLEQLGHTLYQPALPADDFKGAVRIAQAELDERHPDSVVGSSRGGAVAMSLIAGDIPLVLLCPAWKRWGGVSAVKPGTLILHSLADEVIPFEESRELLRNSGLSESSLIVTGNDHRLADADSLQALAAALTAVVDR